MIALVWVLLATLLGLLLVSIFAKCVFYRKLLSAIEKNDRNHYAKLLQNKRLEYTQFTPPIWKIIHPSSIKIFENLKENPTQRAVHYFENDKIGVFWKLIYEDTSK